VGSETQIGEDFFMTQPVRKFRVMQLIDTLELGGAERMAVNIANGLAERGHQSFLCVTRESGPLVSSINDKVSLFNLGRKYRFDFAGLIRLVRFIRRNKIEIVHAHTSSVFVGVVAKLLTRHLSIVWHDHNGNPTTRNTLPFRLLLRGVDFAIAVNVQIQQWMIETIGLNSTRVSYLSNFAILDESQAVIGELPGEDGFRIVCVANIRPQKDHINLLKAFLKVIEVEPKAHLILVGDNPNSELLDKIKQFIESNRLSGSVSIMGQRQDVHVIMKGCDIGVLSSKSEGLPVVLLEYGLAGLATVATDVGQCGEVLDNGKAGIVVAPGSPEALGDELLALLRNSDNAKSLATNLNERVQEMYSEEAFLNRLKDIYASV
jgi:glycosyltransferase involved in cell wall biosynthesis